MLIKELKEMVERITGRKITWEIAKKYEAIDIETGELVAIYNPKNGKLEIMNM